MPDLTIVLFRWCGANEYWETAIKDYAVTYSTRRYPDTDGWHCTCRGYKFRKTCKHIDAAEKQKCDFGQSAAWGSPEPDDAWVGEDCLCPQCGGPSSIVKVAV